MKKKLWTALLCVAAALCLCFGLVACGDGGDNEPEAGNGADGHKHTFTAENVCSECGEAWKYTEGLEYELDQRTDTYTVMPTGMVKGDVVIPYGYQGKFVTSIRAYAFADCPKLTSIIIPDSVTLIEDSAFYNCNGLTSVVIPESVTSIEDMAFWNCSGLTDIQFKGTIEEWQAIEKGSDWNHETGDYIVTCMDGTVTKYGTVTYF